MGGKGGKGGGKGGYRRNDKRKRGGKGEGDGEQAPEKKPKKEELARNDIWREDSGTWELKNEDYEQYYSKQRVCPEEEWPQLVQALRTGLPVAVRINGMRYGATSLAARMEELRQACKDEESKEVLAPTRLTWYPHSIGWHWTGLERRTVKKDPRLVQLKAYLTARERSGMLSRQEAVSMIPPLFLNVEPHHLVLDMCAAPGSKTAQMLEIMHRGARATGLVVANELQWKRANMLAHQVSRLGSPCAAVVNMDAQFFPDLFERAADGSSQALRFDRVLCDVPCSGDGTMRKTPFIWRSWTLKDGLSLHSRQLGILNRGLDLLKVGGRLVYSTCSLNPMEDEAVVAAALKRHEGAIVLAAPPDLDGMQAAEGLQEWFVPNPNGGDMYANFEDVPKEVREGKCKLASTMFTPRGEGSAEILAAIKQHCRRFLPHLMDTGGFFVCAFEKRGECKPTARMRRDERCERIREQKAAAVAEEAATAQEAAAADAAAEPCEAPAAAPEAVAVAEAASPEIPPSGAAEEGAEPQRQDGQATADAQAARQDKRERDREKAKTLRPLSKEYQTEDSVWAEIRDFYGFDPALAQRFMVRAESDQRVFLLSEGLQRLVLSETRMPTRMVLCGVIALERANACHVKACDWRLAQSGAAALYALGLKRCLRVSKEFMLRLLKEKGLSLDGVRSAAEKGDALGLEGLSGDASRPEELRPGSLLVALDADGSKGNQSLVVTANLSDDMLELDIPSAAEVASLLEELEGHPAVDNILQASAGPAEGDAKEEGDAEMTGDGNEQEVEG